MRNLHVALAAISLSITAAPANAGGMICEAVPYAKLGIDTGGSLLVDFAGAGIVNICNLSVTDRGV